MTQPGKFESSAQLEWGTEWKYLAPSPLELFGGTLEGWEKEGMEMIKRASDVLGNPTVCSVLLLLNRVLKYFDSLHTG